LGVLGALLLLLQIVNVLRIVFSKIKTKEQRKKFERYLNYLGRSITKDEFRIKQAAAYKIHNMVNNAYDLHKVKYSADNSHLTRSTLNWNQHNGEKEEGEDGKSHYDEYNHRQSTKSSSRVQALLNYGRATNTKFETIGGVIWYLKSLSNGSLYQKEGVRLNVRVLIGNLTVLIAFLITFFLARSYIKDIKGLWSIHSPLEVALEENGRRDCVSLFNVEECTFATTFGDSASSLGMALCANVEMFKFNANGQMLDESQRSICYDSFRVKADNITTETCRFVDRWFDNLEQTLDVVPNALRNEVDEAYDALNCLAAYDAVNNVTDTSNKIADEDLQINKEFQEVVDGYSNQILMACDRLRNFTSMVKQFLPTNYDIDNVNLDLQRFSRICMASTIRGPTDDEKFVAVTHDSTPQSFCGAQMWNCFEQQEISIETQIDTYNTTTNATTTNTTTTCVLGINEKKPFQFEGARCSQYPAIQDIIETREDIESLFLDLIPPKWLYQLAVAISTIVALSSLIYITVITIPSTVSTTLMFRSGFLPSLRDPRFKNYRVNHFLSSFIIGSMFWSAVWLAVVLFFVTFVVICILFLKRTRFIVWIILALLSGVVITVTIKLILLRIFSHYNFRGFYRKYPLAHNIVTIGLECWHIQLSIVAIATRFVKCLVVIVINLGRLDRPILMDDISIDKIPYWYRHLILTTEAHHHPYIERLGMMYMMKLRYRDRFGKKSGAIWRLLFVFALMPWLQKYRIKNDDIDKLEIQRLMMVHVKKSLIG